MKRVTDLIIGVTHDGAEVGGALTLAEFLAGTATTGEIGVIDAETGLEASATSDVVYIGKACANSDGEAYLRQSLPIHRGMIESYKYSAYAAAAAKEVTVVITGIATTVGTESVIWITDYNDFNYIIGRRRIGYVAVAGDTVDTIGTALALAITNDVSVPNVTATYNAGTDTITIVGKAVQGSGNISNGFRAAHEILFNVIAGDNLVGVAVVNNSAVLPDPGCGTPREVRKMEEIYKGYKGYTNRVIYPTSVNIQYDTDNAATYALFVIEHKQPQHTNTEGDVHAQVVTTIAVPSGQAATFKTDLDAVIAGMS